MPTTLPDAINFVLPYRKQQKQVSSLPASTGLYAQYAKLLGLT